MYFQNAWMLKGDEIIQGNIGIKGSTTTHQPTGDKGIEGKDYLISPGFVDVHIHALCGRDAQQGAEGILAMAKQAPSFGITGFLPTLAGDTPQNMHQSLRGVASAMTDENPTSARIFGAHVEGPFVSPARKGAQLDEGMYAPDIAVWNQIVDGISASVARVTVAPELPGAEPLIKHLVAQGISVGMGHTMATDEQAKQAADWGLNNAIHLFNVMPPMHHRSPGAAGAALVDDRFYLELIADGIHLHPDILRLCAKVGAHRCVLVSDAGPAAGLCDGDYTFLGRTVSVRQGQARLADGTLAGSTITLDEAVRNMVSFGIRLPDALNMASRNARRSANLPALTLDEGQTADWVVLRKSDLAVMMTVIGGRVAYQSKEMEVTV